MGIIYLHECLTTGKKYVGQTINSLEARISHGYNNAMGSAIEKYGWENFQSKIIEECDNEKLNEREMHWIAELNTIAPNGYNLTMGGKSTRGYIHSKESRQKMSEEKLGKKTHEWTEEQKESLRQKMSGSNNPFYGKKHTNNNRKKCIDTLRANFNREAVILGAIKRTKPVYQIDKDNNMIAKFNSVQEAAKAVNGSIGNISSCANGKLKVAYGYKWSFVWTIGF